MKKKTSRARKPVRASQQPKKPAVTRAEPLCQSMNPTEDGPLCQSMNPTEDAPLCESMNPTDTPQKGGSK